MRVAVGVKLHDGALYIVYTYTSYTRRQYHRTGKHRVARGDDTWTPSTYDALCAKTTQGAAALDVERYCLWNAVVSYYLLYITRILRYITYLSRLCAAYVLIPEAVACVCVPALSHVAVACSVLNNVLVIVCLSSLKQYLLSIIIINGYSTARAPSNSVHYIGFPSSDRESTDLMDLIISDCAH